MRRSQVGLSVRALAVGGASSVNRIMYLHIVFLQYIKLLTITGPFKTDILMTPDHHLNSTIIEMNEYYFSFYNGTRHGVLITGFL